MKHLVLTVVLAAAGLAALAAAPATAPPAPAQAEMTFFLTGSGPGDGANLGGLAGADAHCAALAAAAGAAPDLTWRAYLGATGTDPKSRIGSGPWHNANGVLVAADVASLHDGSDALSKENSISEKGEVISGRGDEVNRHDILTGATADGRVFLDEGAAVTCSDWTSNAPDGSARVGHHDRVGGGDDGPSWNSAHNSRGCGQEDLRGTGGDGLFYCFAFRP